MKVKVKVLKQWLSL